ncbi:hypothetical protein F0562_009530 [Nyssa sinensis]|uniref:Uncharacterized protein n=1 Tax=Nyssa sinensis TaxID=561372 RepID=A0A5J5A186_9ASTE|nr:hypothetical protein F0562_009530 [Nyssa sinensis]
MKGTSKVIMGATLIMVVSLAIVLGLVLVLLAELYCSLLLRRRQLRTTSAAAAATTTTTDSSSQPQQTQDQSATAPPFNNLYAQGVLQAPRSLLFPAVSNKEDKVDIGKQYSQFHQILESQAQDPNSTPHQIGLVTPSPSSPSFIAVTSPQPIQNFSLQVGNTSNDGVCGGGGAAACDGLHFVCISNPIYDNEFGRTSRADTPFETPDTSPSRLETGGSSGDDDKDQSSPSSPSSLPITPPLTPMKKLPAQACSVSLRDARISLYLSFMIKGQ